MINMHFEKIIDGTDILEKTILLVEVEEGNQPPYYYVGDGNRIAFCRVGNESIPADGMKPRELVLKRSNYSFDSLKSPYNFSDFSFT